MTGTDMHKLLAIVASVLTLTGVWSGQALAQKDNANDPWRFANVKEWRLTVVYSATDDLEKKADDTYEHYQLSLGGQLDAKLTQQHVSDVAAGFSSGDKTEWPSKLTFAAKSYVKHTDAQGKVTWTERTITAAGPVITGGLGLDIRPDRGIYRLQRAPWMFKSAAVDAKSDSSAPVHAEMPYPLPADYAHMVAQDQNLPKTGLIIEGAETFDAPSAPFAKSAEAKRDLKVTVKWTLKPWEEECDPRIEAPADWLPEEGAQTSVKTSWNGTVTAVKLTLYDVSSEKGACLNSKDKSEDPDLAIADGAAFTVERTSKNSWTATATANLKGENAITLPLVCRDWGAWGKVKCEVKFNGAWQTAKDAGGKDYVSIPKDDNENHIADKWEKDYDVVGLPENWDLAEVPGQKAKGDGLTLYEKYRGLIVIDNAKSVHKRLDPREKAHFVIDPDGLFDASRWFKTSGIRAYKLSKDMVDDSRRVDFNCGASQAGGKYAVRVEKVMGDGGNPAALASAESIGPENVAWTPKTCDLTRILPDRIGAMLDRVLAKMKAALKDPDADANKDEAKVLADVASQAGLTMADVKRIVDNFDAAARQQRIDKLIALTAIHEMGHACGLMGHLVPGTKQEDDETIRNRDCPMQYLVKPLARRLILLGELGGDGTFCKRPPDNCWRDLNVKN